MIFVRRAAATDSAAIDACIAGMHRSRTTPPLAADATRDVFVAERGASVLGVLVLRRDARGLAIELLATRAHEPSEPCAAVLFRHARSCALQQGIATLGLELDRVSIDTHCRAIAGAHWTIAALEDGSGWQAVFLRAGQARA